MFDLSSITNVQFMLSDGYFRAKTNTNVFDTRGGNAAAVVIQTGTAAGAGFLNVVNTITPVFRESADATVANSTNIPAERVLEQRNVLNTNTAYIYGVVPAIDKPYVFTELIVNGTVNVNVSVSGILGGLVDNPDTPAN